jgi:hypothetical protein
MSAGFEMLRPRCGREGSYLACISVYFLDTEKQIMNRLEIEADDDVVQTDVAREHPTAVYEIWELARLVRSSDGQNRDAETDDNAVSLRRIES